MMPREFDTLRVAMASSGRRVTGIQASLVQIARIRRFWKTREKVEELYLKACEFSDEKNTEVVITSGSHEGGGTAGQIAGHPEEIMAACEVVLQEIEAENTCGVAPARNGGKFYDFSRRRVGT